MNRVLVAGKPTQSKPKLELVVQYDPDLDFFEYAKEVIEKAREGGAVVKAVMIGLPSRILLEGQDDG